FKASLFQLVHHDLFDGVALIALGGGGGAHINQEHPFLFSGVHRQGAAGILHQGDAAVGSLIAVGLMLGAADAVQAGLVRDADGLLVEVQVGLHAQNPVQGVGKALLGEIALVIGGLHVGNVLVDVVGKEDHVAAGNDGAGNGVLPLGGGGHAHHVGGVGDDRAVEAQLAPQQAGDQFRGHGGGLDVLVLNAREIGKSTRL